MRQKPAVHNDDADDLMASHECVSEPILADHLPPRRNRGRKVAQIEVAARSLLNHRVGKGLGKPEIAGFVLFCIHSVCPSLTSHRSTPNIAIQLPAPPMIGQTIAHYCSDKKRLACLWSDDLVVAIRWTSSHIRFLCSPRKSIVHATSQFER